MDGRGGARTGSIFGIAETLTAKRASTRMIFKRVFGRKTTPSEQPDIGRDGSSKSRRYGANVELDMKEVASYAAAMARHRGYEDETAAMIARRVVFLERRNLPGLGNLHREVFLYHNQPLDSRFSFQSIDGLVGGGCPFYAGVALEPSFEMLTALPPEDRRWAPAPSNALLFVPKLAEWLRPTGRRAVFWWAKNKKVPGFIVVEGYRLGYYCKLSTSDAANAIEQADLIGFSDCPDDFKPEPEVRSGFREKITLIPRHIALIEDYLRS